MPAVHMVIHAVLVDVDVASLLNTMEDFLILQEKKFWFS